MAAVCSRWHAIIALTKKAIFMTHCNYQQQFPLFRCIYSHCSLFSSGHRLFFFFFVSFLFSCLVPAQHNFSFCHSNRIFRGENVKSLLLMLERCVCSCLNKRIKWRCTGITIERSFAHNTHTHSSLSKLVYRSYCHSPMQCARVSNAFSLQSSYFKLDFKSFWQ